MKWRHHIEQTANYRSYWSYYLTLILFSDLVKAVKQMTSDISKAIEASGEKMVEKIEHMVLDFAHVFGGTEDMSHFVQHISVPRREWGNWALPRVLDGKLFLIPLFYPQHNIQSCFQTILKKCGVKFGENAWSLEDMRSASETKLKFRVENKLYLVRTYSIDIHFFWSMDYWYMTLMPSGLSGPRCFPLSVKPRSPQSSSTQAWHRIEVCIQRNVKEGNNVQPNPQASKAEMVIQNQGSKHYGDSLPTQVGVIESLLTRCMPSFLFIWQALWVAIGPCCHWWSSIPHLEA